MSQSSIVECWLHKWWRCLPLCIGPWCSIVRWCPIVQSEIHRVYIINAILGSKTSFTIERKWNRQKRFVISVDISFICAIYMYVNKRKVIQLIYWLIPRGTATDRQRERERWRERGSSCCMNMENSWSWPWKCSKPKRPEQLQKYANICIFISTVSSTHMRHTHKRAHTQPPHIHLRRDDAGKMLIKPTGNGAKAAANQVGGQQRSILRKDRQGESSERGKGKRERTREGEKEVGRDGTGESGACCRRRRAKSETGWVSSCQQM